MFHVWVSSTFTQPVVNVWGSGDSLMIKKYAEWYLDHMNVNENMHLTVTIHPEMPDDIKGLTIPLQSPEPDLYQVFKVMIDANLNKKQLRLVLAHEMVHVKQYIKKELIPFNEKGVIWRGKKYNYAFAYNQETPWEREAHRIDNALANLVQVMYIDNIENESYPGYVANPDWGTNLESAIIISNTIPKINTNTIQKQRYNPFKGCN